MADDDLESISTSPLPEKATGGDPSKDGAATSGERTTGDNRAPAKSDETERIEASNADRSRESPMAGPKLA